MLAKISDLFHSWARGWLILALFATFVVFIVITLPALQASPGGSIESLDTRFFYMPDETFSIVGSYGEATSFWILIYMTWDIINPILYSLIFGLLISWLLQRGFNPDSKLQKLNVVPVGAGLFDVLENISIAVLLAVYPAQPTIVAWLSTVFTMSKIILLGLSILLIVVGVIGAALNRFQKRRRLTLGNQEV